MVPYCFLNAAPPESNAVRTTSPNPRVRRVRVLAHAPVPCRRSRSDPGGLADARGQLHLTGVSNNGTLGVGHRITPGFIFDATGTGTFDPANDYLTPGMPQEGFSISYDGSGVLANNNAGGTIQIGSTAAPTTIATAYDHSVVWSGTIDGVLTIEHVYGLNDDARQLDITTTITALTDLENLKFARWIDPDSGGDSGGASSINSRGNATVGLDPEDWVNSVSEINGATLGLFSDSAVSHNTAISEMWSIDPAFYIAGSGNIAGDHTIGIGFNIGNLSTGNSTVLEYSYAVSADQNDLDVGKVVWKGGTNSLWNERTNWDPQQPPGDGSPVNIASTGNALINHNVTGNTYSSWSFNAGSAAVNVQGNDVRLADGATLSNSSSHLQSFDARLVSAGNLTVNGGTSGLSLHDVTVADGSNFTFNTETASNNIISGPISGNNITLTNSGSGTLTLSSANTFSGNVVVSSGTLKLSGGDNRLPTSVGVTVQSGGTWDVNGTSQQINTLNCAGNITLGGSGILIVSSGSMSGSVLDAGTIRHTGTGTLTVSGNLLHSGSVLVADNGVLDVSGTIAGVTTIRNGATLRGTGTFDGGLHLESGSRHTPGNSIGTVDTTDYVFDSGATLEVEVDDNGNSDLINDSGTVTINGGTVQVKPDTGVDPNNFQVGDEYTFIHSTNPIQGAGFEQVVNVGFDFPVAVLIRELYDYKLRLLGFHRLSYTPNQAAVGEWLDAAAVNGTADGELTDVMAAIGSVESFETMRQSLDQLSGEIHPTAALASIQVADMFYIRTAHMIRPVGSRSSNKSDAAVSTSGHWIVRGQNPDTCWGGGVFGYGIGGSTAGDGNASGFGLSTGGTTAIIERQVGSGSDVGFFFDYAHSNVGLRELADAGGIDSYRWGSYVTCEADDAYWTLIGSMGYDQYDTTRGVTFGSDSNQVNELVQSSHDGWQAGTYLERGWQIQPTAHLLLQPYVALQYLYLHTDRVLESGGGPINGALDADDLHSLRTRLGLSTNLVRYARGALSFDTAWTHELLHETAALVNNRLAGSITTSTFVVRGVDLGRDWVSFGPSAELNLRSNLKLWASYYLNLNDNQVFHTGSGGLVMLW